MMAIKTYRPYTPSRRGTAVIDYRKLLSGDKPEKSLLEVKQKRGGRNHQGRLTVRSRGGGSRQHYRLVDFGRKREGAAATVKSLQYDPNRSAFIALVQYPDGQLSYIIAPEGLKVGATVISGAGVEIRLGNTLVLDRIPDGTLITVAPTFNPSGAMM
jgi:large subunit ribosomal protein L2